MTIFKIIYYSNKNLPRAKWFTLKFYPHSVVFMFKYFDICLWAGCEEVQ